MRPAGAPPSRAYFVLLLLLAAPPLVLPGVVLLLELLPLGVVTEPDPETEPEPLVDRSVVVDEEPDGAVDGDADGLRPAGPSPTRSVLVSEQPASAVSPRASAQAPVNTLFMTHALLVDGCCDPNRGGNLQPACPRPS